MQRDRCHSGEKRRIYARNRRRRKRLRLCALLAAVVLVLAVLGAVCFYRQSEGTPEEPVSNEEPAYGEGTDPPGETLPLEEIGPSEQTPLPEASPPEPEPYQYLEPVPASEAVDTSYFDDAVFIGDSRTEGLLLNTGLSNATGYVSKGLMVDTVFTKKVINKDGQKLSVIDALRATDFAKVYIMLGINETGWPYRSVFVEKYGEILDTIREINPEAVIYIQEIIPVSEEVSSTHDYVKNSKIAELNGLLKKLAAEKQVYYIDVSAAVAAENGSLPADAATDGIHLKKEYCNRWLEYLKTHTVQ